MKVSIPPELTKDIPQTLFGKILSATPVVMAVVSTMLAGLASSEMTRAQYDRALAAQQQSKAGDQWSFFQAKRLRGALQRNAADLLLNISGLRPFSPTTFRKQVEQWLESDSTSAKSEAAAVQNEMLEILDSSAAQQALVLLQGGELPALPSRTPLEPVIKAALDGLDDQRPGLEMARLLAQVSPTMIEDTLRAAKDRAQAFDGATQPVNQVIDRIDNLLFRYAACLPDRSNLAADGLAQTTDPSGVNRGFTLARLRYAAQRYEVEARLNQEIANLYELQVRQSNISAERHHRRSQSFFLGMLGAQMGVIISTLAMAARMRNLLWSLAATAGLLAVAFAIYVYLWF